MDAAFQFYYSENLEALERLGAELVMINALTATPFRHLTVCTSAVVFPRPAPPSSPPMRNSASPSNRLPRVDCPSMPSVVA